MFSTEMENFHTPLSSRLAPECMPDFPGTPLISMNTNPITCEIYTSPSLHRLYARGRNINRLSISCGFRHRLRTASPLADCHRQGNLGLTVWRFLTAIVVTCANILTSLRSTAPHGYGFTAKRTLSYHMCASLKGGINRFLKEDWTKFALGLYANCYRVPNKTITTFLHTQTSPIQSNGKEA